MELERTPDDEGPCTLAAREQALLLEDRDGVPDRGLADAELLREHWLCGQPAIGVRAGPHRIPDVTGGPLREAELGSYGAQQGHHLSRLVSAARRARSTNTSTQSSSDGFAGGVQKPSAPAVTGPIGVSSPVLGSIQAASNDDAGSTWMGSNVRHQKYLRSPPSRIPWRDSGSSPDGT